MKQIDFYIIEKLHLNKDTKMSNDYLYNNVFIKLKNIARGFVGLNGWEPGEYTFKKYKDGTFGIHFKEKYSFARLGKIWKGFYKELEERDMTNIILNKPDEVQINLSMSDILYKMNKDFK
jgi:hypothetical protein